MIRPDEFDARVQRLRAEAGGRGLAGALVFSWRRAVVAWFTGYRPGFVTNQVAFWVPVTGPFVLAPRFGFEESRAATPWYEVAPAAAPASLPPEGSAIGLVASDLAIDERSVTLIDALADRGIRAVDLGPTVTRWRSVKSPAEQEAAAHAARIGADALLAAGACAIVGEVDHEIAARVEAAARSLGAYRAGCLVGIGDGAVVTEATGRRVGPDEPVGLELTLETPMGCAHVNHTLAPTRPRPVDVRAEAVCREARQALLEAMRPGVAVDDVVAAGDAVLARHDLLAYKEYDFGHGTGMETPEIPRLVSGTDEVLVPGMTISVHVSVRRPGGETAFFGGPVVVEADGPRELVPTASWVGATRSMS